MMLPTKIPDPFYLVGEEARSQTLRSEHHTFDNTNILGIIEETHGGLKKDIMETQMRYTGDTKETHRIHSGDIKETHKRHTGYTKEIQGILTGGT